MLKFDFICSSAFTVSISNLFRFLVHVFVHKENILSAWALETGMENTFCIIFSRFLFSSVDLRIWIQFSTTLSHFLPSIIFVRRGCNIQNSSYNASRLILGICSFDTMLHKSWYLISFVNVSGCKQWKLLFSEKSNQDSIYVSTFRYHSKNIVVYFSAWEVDIFRRICWTAK